MESRVLFLLLIPEKKIQIYYESSRANKYVKVMGMTSIDLTVANNYCHAYYLFILTATQLPNLATCLSP